MQIKVPDKLFMLMLLPVVALLFSCNSSDKNVAAKQADEISKNVKAYTPGSVPVSKDGFQMHATINGKLWEAESMMPPNTAGRILGEGGGESIGLPYSRGQMRMGAKESFSADNAVDLFTNDDVAIWGGRKGEMEIINVTDKFAEGKFFFTGTTSRSDKTIEVTDGYFKILLDVK